MEAGGVGFGSVSCSAANYTCTYTPPAGFTGVDALMYCASHGIATTDARIRILLRPSLGNSSPTRFRYTVRDPQGNLDTTTVTLKPGNWSYNRAPVLAPDQLTTARNTPLQFSIFDLMRNDYDPDNDQLNLSVAWATQHATITCTTPHYLCTYTPHTSFTGVDSFSYQGFDGTNYLSATVTVNVTP